MTYQVLAGNNIELLKTLADNSVDSIVTDPPYGINFLGKSWDADTGSIETYRECYRVLKPGGHILAFSAARTYHHLAVAIEQSGFEIRDQIMWIYGSGFPKSQDIGKQIERREGKRQDAKSGRKYSNWDDAGVLNATTCNTCGKNNVVIGSQFKCDKTDCDMRERLKPADNEWSGWGTSLKPAHEPIVMARKPISEKNIADNCQKHGTGAINIDATRVPAQDSFGGGKDIDIDHHLQGRFPANVIGDIQEEYQKYFYCPKVSRSERSIGDSQNNHPTVKPVELMKYLIKLVTPLGGTVLDPFNGSGSTGMAAVELGYNYIGMDLDPHYVEISLKRIAAWELQHKPTAYSALFSE